MPLVHTSVRLPTFNGVFVRDREPEWDAVEAAVRGFNCAVLVAPS